MSIQEKIKKKKERKKGNNKDEARKKVIKDATLVKCTFLVKVPIAHLPCRVTREKSTSKKEIMFNFPKDPHRHPSWTRLGQQWPSWCYP